MADKKNADQTAQPNPFAIRTLSEILSIRKYDELSDEDRTNYDEAFAAFRQDHDAKYADGQNITVKIAQLQGDSISGFKFIMTPGPNTYTAMFKMVKGNADVLFQNAIGTNCEAAVYALKGATDKGAFKLRVKLVDATDTYVTREGAEEYYRGPQVAVIGNQEYVPSAEVQGVFKELYHEAAKQALMASMVAPAATAKKAVEVHVDEDDAELLGN